VSGKIVLLNSYIQRSLLNFWAYFWIHKTLALRQKILNVAALDMVYNFLTRQKEGLVYVEQ